MNILIKNSDFSQVSIGSVGNLQIGPTLTHIYFSPSGNSSYISGNLKQVCVDISQVSGSRIKVTGNAGTAKVLGAFYSGNAPTQDISFSNSTEVNSFMTNTMVEILGYFTTESEGVFTKTVDIPDGANTLIINIGTVSTDIAMAIELV